MALNILLIFSLCLANNNQAVIILFKKILCMYVYMYIFIIIVQVEFSPFSPYHSPLSHLSPAPTLNPTPLALSIDSLCMSLDDPSPVFPHYPLPPPLWLLSVCSLKVCCAFLENLSLIHI